MISLMLVKKIFLYLLIINNVVIKNVTVFFSDVAWSLFKKFPLFDYVL